MNSIVVYRIIIIGWFVLLASGLDAQKPAIDLISTHRQYRHPEAVIDTGYAEAPLFKEGFFTPTVPIQNSSLRKESEKKKRHQIGPSLDSIFQKEESKAPLKEESTTKISVFSRKMNPVKTIFFITALK